MIDVNLLHQFCVFAKHGTLVGAAEELHISQPALSRSMKRLEANLGVRLFTRSNSKLTLNETGIVAAEGAKELLKRHEEWERHVLDFDRSLHTITIGSCAPYPFFRIMPTIQSMFGDMTITSELASDEMLLQRIRSRRYQIAILRKHIDNSDLVCQRYSSEHLYIAIPKTHRLAHYETVRFSDLAGESFLVQPHIGFWMDICREYMPNIKLLLQTDANALGELVEGTDFPAFCSDRMIESGQAKAPRVNIPIDEPEAHVTYYVACLDAEKKRFSSLFNAIRAEIIAE